MVNDAVMVRGDICRVMAVLEDGRLVADAWRGPVVESNPGDFPRVAGHFRERSWLGKVFCSDDYEFIPD